MLSVNTNISAINAHISVAKNDQEVAKHTEKLSSGLRINRASDDATGLSVANSLLTQVNGVAQAQANAQDGLNLLNTTDGALSTINDDLQRVRELAVQASNGTLTASDRANADAEAQQLLSDINNTSNNTSFNGITPLSSATTNLTFQVGADNGQTLATTITGTSTGSLGLTGLSLSTQAGATAALTSLDSAISQVDTQRASIGAVSNRLEHTVSNLGVSFENQSAAESQIRDADVADETMKLTTSQIMSQSSIGMLAQANLRSQALLSLLR